MAGVPFNTDGRILNITVRRDEEFGFLLPLPRHAVAYSRKEPSDEEFSDDDDVEDL